MRSTQTAAQQIRASRDELLRSFEDRPHLTEVVEALIQDWISEWFAPFALRASELWIGVIQRSEGGVIYARPTRLSEALIRRCISNTALNYTPDHHRLLTTTGNGGFTPMAIAVSVDDVELMLNSLAPEVLGAFQAKLVGYWNACSTQDPLSTRWRLVARHLQHCLKSARQSPPLTPVERQSLLTGLYTQKAERVRFGRALRIFQVYAGSAGQPGQWLALLVLQQPPQPKIYVYSPAKSLFQLDSLDELGALLPRYMNDHSPGVAIQWTVTEPQADVFDCQAQALLEKQLRDIAKVDWQALPEPASYERLFSRLTSPLVWFEPRQAEEPGEEQLPGWLQTAARADREDYGQWLARLAQVQQRSDGVGFLDGIDPIDVYARKALARQMAIDHPQRLPVNPDDCELAFVRTQGATVGWTEKTSRSLTSWSLENPFATAYASVRVHPQKAAGDRGANWLTPAYLKRLIETVDVGRTYPALLKDRLILDPVESSRRQQLFVEQMRVQLPLLALEYCLRKRNGLTYDGYRLVSALLHEDPAQRQLEAKVIVGRHLAFLAYAGGRVHRAFNLFVIGPRDNSQLPHILYEPSQVEPLRQFPSRQALLDEVAREGSELQRRVLQSFTENSRAVFANGGFVTPHVTRFLQGDEFESVPRHGRALLSDVVMPEGFLAEVFNENARQLWGTADRQSTSNEELRWTLFKNDLWQVFNVVLPMMRGPAAAVGWLFQLWVNTQAFAALPQDAAQAERAGAVTDLIASLSGILLSHVETLDERLGLVGTKPAVRRLALDLPMPAPERLASSGVAGRASVVDVTAMDFSWANANQRPNTSQLTALQAFEWRPADGAAWPDIPANLEREGAARGLVRVTIGSGRWHHHAVIDGRFYPVGEFEGRPRVIDLQQARRWGPWLKRDRAGLWTFDLGLRLRGGGPKKTAAARRQEIQRYNEQLERSYSQLTERCVNAERSTYAAFTLHESAYQSSRERFTDQQRTAISARYLKELQGQSRLQFEQIDLLKARNTNRPMPHFEVELIQQLESLVENLRHQMALLILERKAAQPSGATRALWLVQLNDEDEAVALLAHQAMNEYLAKVAVYNDQLIELSILERARTAELNDVPGFDLATSPLADVERFNAGPLDWKALQLKVYQGLVLRRPPLPEEYEDFVDLKRLTDQVILATCSQKTLQESELVSLDERIKGLDQILLEYRDAQSWLAFYGETATDLIDRNNIQALYRHIDAVRHEALIALAVALREHEHEQQSQRQPAPRPALAPGRRLVRDRKNRVMIGQVRERTPGVEGEIVDVIDPVDHRAVASFRQDIGSAQWDEVLEPLSARPKPLRSLKKLQTDARALLNKEPALLQQIRKDALTSKTPIGAQAHLTHLADAMTEIGAKVREALAQRTEQDEKQKVAAESLLASLEQASARLVEQGRQVRIEIIKRNPPNEQGIDYLKAQNEVDILLVDGRLKLKRDNDYLQEYVVKHKDGKVLAYAHFHYPAADTPNLDYSAAHLKLPEQRYLSFRSLADMPESRVVEVYYARIHSRLAAPLFLNVTRSIPRRASQPFW